MSRYNASQSRIEISELRAGLRETLQEVLQHGQRLVITRHGREIAALVPVGDLQALEKTADAAAEALETEARNVELTPGKGLSVRQAIARSRNSTRPAAYAPQPQDIEINLDEFESLKLSVKEFATVQNRQGRMLSALVAAAKKDRFRKTAA